MAARHALRTERFKAFSLPNSCQYYQRPFTTRHVIAKRRAMRHSVASSRNSDKPILLFDVMDTIVWDPFYTEMPLFFNMKFQDLLKEKDSTAWPEFEKGAISEDELFECFFRDRRKINGPGLLHHVVQGYRYLEGMETLLLELQRQGVEMHAITNYPLWYKRIEAKLALSRYLPWTFVSCEGPMKGLRKPAPDSFKVVSETLQVPPEQLLLIDDRQANVVGALEAGWSALLYKNTPALCRDLVKRRILDGRKRSDPG